MTKFDAEKRLSEELGLGYIHLNMANPDEDITEELYQELKEYFEQLQIRAKNKQERRKNDAI
jgi:phosphoribosyl 1,2-cyclic phosphodiesterase